MTPVCTSNMTTLSLQQTAAMINEFAGIVLHLLKYLHHIAAMRYGRFPAFFQAYWQGTHCKHLKLDEGWKNSRISRTMQRIDTRPVLLCLQGPVLFSDINIVGLVLSWVTPHLKVLKIYHPIIDGLKVLDI